MNHQYGDCTYCGGEVTERRISKPCFWGDALIALVADVPTGVCDQCGERYYRAEVLRDVERILKAGADAQVVEVPLLRFSES
jgi:YgiT-type zinc finger domain-containing protein